MRAFNLTVKNLILYRRHAWHDIRMAWVLLSYYRGTCMILPYHTRTLARLVVQGLGFEASLHYIAHIVGRGVLGNWQATEMGADKHYDQHCATLRCEPRKSVI